jgi:methylated-DNA-protein-cysteine methyltransferase-like protein
MQENFFHQVYEVVKLIPKGRVTSYGAIAKYLSSPKAARMVGWAMNNSHNLEDNIPAQRVVNRIGLLTGKAFFGKGNEMAMLLKKEGIEVKDDQIMNFEKYFWDPSIELAL